MSTYIEEHLRSSSGGQLNDCAGYEGRWCYEKGLAAIPGQHRGTRWLAPAPGYGQTQAGG